MNSAPDAGLKKRKKKEKKKEKTRKREHTNVQT